MEVLTLLGLLVSIPLLIFYSIFSWGFVASVFYVWFVTPLFPEAPPLNWIHFVGIALMIKTIVPTSSFPIKDEFKDKKQVWLTLILNPWLLLLVGWLFKIIFI